MILTPQQDVALNSIENWWRYEKRARPFILNGYAGTGKTTTAKTIAGKIGIRPEEVIYVAYTGKAALQLRKKGCDEATTAHKLLYKPVTKGSKELESMQEKLAKLHQSGGHAQAIHDLKRNIKAEKKRIEELTFEVAPDEVRIQRSKIIIVDESSMISKKIADDLMATGLPVIYCGDPFQLPPVRGRSPIADMNPDVVLTDVVRQAMESPVLEFATRLRAGNWFDLSGMSNKNGTSEMTIMPRDHADFEIYDSADQILCASNITRKTINQRIRKKKLEQNKVFDPENRGCGCGDRIIFLNNDYGAELFNGSMGVIEKIYNLDPSDVNLDYPHHYWNIGGCTDETRFDDYIVYNRQICDPKNVERKMTQSIDLAYAVTCHKSQGSEWDNVLVHFEGLRDTNMARWLYTAVTRAREKCVITIPRGERI